LNPLGYHVVNLALHLLNVVGVYAVTIRIDGRRESAVAAAILFGCSSIAFTPLHWAAGVVELLTGTLLISTFHGSGGRSPWPCSARHCWRPGRTGNEPPSVLPYSAAIF
jgi:hypothetical protein